MGKLLKGRVGWRDKKKISLDLKDIKILSLLSEDSRMPSSRIAKIVKLSRDVVNYRIKKLIKNEIILRFIPTIDLEKIGYRKFYLFMMVDEKDKGRAEQLKEFLVNHPNTKSLIEYISKWDLEWVIVAKDVNEFDEIITKVINDFDDVITQKNRLEVIREYKLTQLPNKLKIINKPKKEVKRIGYQPDKKDFNILKELSDNARVSSYDLGRRVGLSSDAVIYRIKKMTAAWIIMNFTTVINLDALNYNWYTLCLDVKKFDENDEAKLNTFVLNHPYIFKVVKVLGHWDLMVYITADDVVHFHNTVKEITGILGDKIVNFETWATYKEHSYIGNPRIIFERC